MSRLSITPTDGRANYAPGEVLSGVASWQGVPSSARLQLRLFWFTSGKGSMSTEVIDTIDVPAAQADGSYPFSFKLPESPYSFSGQLISLQWAIELVASRDDVARFEFPLAPGGREVNLYAHPPDPDRGPEKAHFELGRSNRT